MIIGIVLIVLGGLLIYATHAGYLGPLMGVFPSE